jgi:hypothetical protein
MYTIIRHILGDDQQPVDFGKEEQSFGDRADAVSALNDIAAALDRSGVVMKVETEPNLRVSTSLTQWQLFAAI